MVRRSNWLVLSIIFIAGCASPPTPPDQYYRIYADEISESDLEPPLDGVLVVRRFLSDGLVGERSVVYSDGDDDNPLFQYHYHHWTESPTRMLQEQLVPYLRRAHVAREVTTPDIQVDAEFELLGKIRRMEQLRGDSPKVTVDFEFALTRTRRAELIWLQSYTVEVLCRDDSLVAAVAAFNEAVSQIFAELSEDIHSN
jgi:ABC-type uncharacterized transport system auxiliary subunit